MRADIADTLERPPAGNLGTVVLEAVRAEVFETRAFEPSPYTLERTPGLLETKPLTADPTETTTLEPKHHELSPFGYVVGEEPIIRPAPLAGEPNPLLRITDYRSGGASVIEYARSQITGDNRLFPKRAYYLDAEDQRYELSVDHLTPKFRL